MLRYKTKRTANGLDVRFLRLFEGLRLTKRSVQFRMDSICIVSRILGIPVDRRWFDASLIYGFGFVAHGHSHARVLQFNYAGQGEIVLASDVQESEVAAFVKYLHKEGFGYSTSWERPLKPQFADWA